jgi:hypothetical protein
MSNGQAKGIIMHISLAAGMEGLVLGIQIKRFIQDILILKKLKI